MPHSDYAQHVSGMVTAPAVLPGAAWRAVHDAVVPPAEFGLVRQQGELEQGQAVAVRPPSSGAATQAVVAEVEVEVDTKLQRDGSGCTVAGAVFHSLHGEWELHRQITSRLASSPSGVFIDSEVFQPVRLAEGGGGGSSSSSSPLPWQYLYREQGQFAIDGGAVMRVRREYVYKYDSTADRLDVYFADGGAGGNFFHSLRFLAPGEQAPALEEVTAEVPSCSTCGGVSVGLGLRAEHRLAAAGLAAGAPETAGALGAAGTDDRSGCWRAVGEHLCVRGMYYSSYRFWFEGVRLRQFEIEFLVVQGPNKDYTATATYTRT